MYLISIVNWNAIPIEIHCLYTENESIGKSKIGEYLTNGKWKPKKKSVEILIKKLFSSFLVAIYFYKKRRRLARRLNMCVVVFWFHIQIYLFNTILL